MATKKVPEVLTLNVSQCGIQLGQVVWKQYCVEHKIDKQGQKNIKIKKTHFYVFMQKLVLDNMYHVI